MNQQAGASCPSRTPSISLAPRPPVPSPSPLPLPLSLPARDHQLSSLFPLLSWSSLRHPLRCSIRCADTRRNATYYLVLLKRYFSLGTSALSVRSSPSFAEEINQENISTANIYRTFPAESDSIITKNGECVRFDQNTKCTTLSTIKKKRNAVHNFFNL